jgi:hypothetical protein
MMKCGHAANAKDTNTGAPVCVICVGIYPGATEVDDSPPDLTGRMAKCTYCKTTQPSDPEKRPFFEYRPNCEFDNYYCGCRGWE